MSECQTIDLTATVIGGQLEKDIIPVTTPFEASPSTPVATFRATFSTPHFDKQKEDYMNIQEETKSTPRTLLAKNSLSNLLNPKSKRQMPTTSGIVDYFTFSDKQGAQAEVQSALKIEEQATFG